MSIIIGGKSCEEMRDGFEESVDSQGVHATKKFLCAWADRLAVASGLLGFTSGTGSGGPVTTTPPMAYPEIQNLYAREITIEGKGKCTQGTKQLQFTQAVITAHYGTSSGWSPLPLPNMSIDPESPYTFATQEIDFAREDVTIEGSSCTLANGTPFSTPFPYAVPLPHAVLTIQLQQVPYLPAQAILLMMAKPLNNATFLGVPPGFLKFEGCKSHMEAMSDGSYSQNLSLVFKVRPVLRWDEVFDPAGVTAPTQIRYLGLAILQRSNLATLIPAAYGGQGP